jgi:hypothetical protein
MAFVAVVFVAVEFVGCLRQSCLESGSRTDLDLSCQMAPGDLAIAPKLLRLRATASFHAGSLEH